MDAHRSGRQVVHVRGDSQKELEALFSRVMNPSEASRQPSSVPMRMRKLPDSFFKPPEPRGHSRQASSDGGVCGSLTPHHSRTVSAPAALPVNSLSTQAADVAATSIIPDDVPLPPGWEMAKTPTGQRYFLNHLDKTTTWLDPRLSQLQSAQHPIANAPVHSHSFSNPAPTTQAQSVNPESGPLPEGWEQAVTPEGEMYYIDHINKTTTWVDPRLGPPPQVTQQVRGQINQAAAPKRTDSRTFWVVACMAVDHMKNQMSAGLDHDRSGQVLVPSVDARIRHFNIIAHSRNESTDSGLSVSSLPRTNDHMLSPVDHMDTGNALKHTKLFFPLNAVPVELGPMLPMSEGEELMPCIPEGLSSDLLMDMETVLSGSHMDRDNLLTWL
uniref:WW domain-containing protein n=1 Tax=Oryzias latipes TaxID=8090 RepID=A0A3P9I183_ORYLA